MDTTYIPPSTGKPSFSCPYCGAHATQYWHGVNALPMKKGILPTNQQSAKEWGSMDEEKLREQMYPDRQLYRDAADAIRKTRAKLQQWYGQIESGQIFFHEIHFMANKLFDHGKSKYADILNLSQCHSCQHIAVWVYDLMVYPLARSKDVPSPNQDMPPDVKKIYDEAASILDLSPTGAAALLRLATDKLCERLEPEGRVLNERIGNLVKQGLPEEIQRALDVLRVTGNNFVHPGRIDLGDDKVVARSLFNYLNLIVEDRISRPKSIDEAYQTLPEGTRNSIARRDAKEN